MRSITGMTLHAAVRSAMLGFMYGLFANTANTPSCHAAGNMARNSKVSFIAVDLRAAPAILAECSCWQLIVVPVGGRKYPNPHHQGSLRGQNLASSYSLLVRRIQDAECDIFRLRLVNWSSGL